MYYKLLDLMNKNKIYAIIIFCAIFYCISQVANAFLCLVSLLFIAFENYESAYFLISILTAQIIGLISGFFAFLVLYNFIKNFNLIITSIVSIFITLIESMFFILWLNFKGSDNYIDFILSVLQHMFLPNYSMLPQYIDKILLNNGALLVTNFILACICTIVVVYYLWSRITCKICRKFKTTYSSPKLLIPISTYENFQSENRDFSLLENFQITFSESDYGKIYIELCDNCKKAILSVIKITQVPTSNCGKRLMGTIMCQNIEVDYEWAKKLIALHQKEEKKNQPHKPTI